MTERNDIVITGIVAFVAIGLLLILILPQSSAEDILIINTATNTTCQDITAICYDGDNSIDSNDVVIYTTATPAIVVNKNSTGALIGMQISSFAGNPSMQYLRAQGSPSSPSAVVSGNVIGANQGNGYDGNSYETGANFRFLSTETWTDSAHGSKIELRCVVPATTTVFNCLVLDQFGLDKPNIDYAITTITSSTYSATLNDYIILCDTTSNSVTITLPTPNSADNRLYILKRISSGANTCTIDTAGSELIEGNASVDLAVFTGFASSANSNDITLVWDGSQWWNVD